MTNQPILVVSATGKTGSRVVAKLKADRPAPSGMAPITFHFAIGNREFHKRGARVEKYIFCAMSESPEVLEL